MQARLHDIQAGQQGGSGTAHSEANALNSKACGLVERMDQNVGCGYAPPAYPV